MLVITLVMALLMASTTERPLSDPDIYLHLAVGRWIVAQGEIPLADVFSHSLAGSAWVPHQWLSQVILYAWQNAFGWSGLMFLGALMFGITLAWLWIFLRDRMPWIYALALLALTFFCMVTHFQVRPHILAWPLLACWTSHIMDRSESGRTPDYALLLVMVLWVNVHGSFMLGLVILAFIAVESVLRHPATWKAWLGFVIATLLACLLNPVGWKLLVFTIKMPLLTTLTYLTEWSPPRFTGLNPLALSVVFLVSLGLMGRLRISPIRLALLLLLLFQAVHHARYVSLFGLLAPFLVARGIRPSRPTATQDVHSNAALSWTMGVAVFFTCAMLCWQLQNRPYQPGSRITPSRAVDRMMSQSVMGKGLNFFNYGAYLIYRGVPVFIDGRLDVYGDAHMQNYLAIVDTKEPVDLQTKLDELGISWTLFPRDDSINALLLHHPAWKLIHEDEQSMLFVRRGLRLF